MPRLFPDNPQEGQVKQGLLGDCWFLCACAALQKSRYLLEQVSDSAGFSSAIFLSAVHRKEAGGQAAEPLALRGSAALLGLGSGK